jgi:hypothetical protein
MSLLPNLLVDFNRPVRCCGLTDWSLLGPQPCISSILCSGQFSSLNSSWVLQSIINVHYEKSVYAHSTYSSLISDDIKNFSFHFITTGGTFPFIDGTQESC